MAKTEIELKLLINNSDISKVIKNEFVIEHMLDEPDIQHINNTYYDTPKYDLMKNNMALRIRSINNSIYYLTMKSKVDGKDFAINGLHERIEYDYPLVSDNVDFSNLPNHFKELIGPYVDFLGPIFTTNFQRISIMLGFSGNQRVELAIDQGEVSASEKIDIISEVEIELFNGSPEILHEIANELSKTILLKPSNISKAERGYRLINGITSKQS